MRRSSEPGRSAIRALALALLFAPAALAVTPDPVPFTWPANPARAELLAYLGASLVEPPATAARPTAEERRARAPFVMKDGGVAIDLAALRPELAKPFRDFAPPLTDAQFLEAAERAYHARRVFPDRLAELLKGATGAGWRAVVVDSAIHRGPRRIRFHAPAALANLTAGGWPVGTVFVAEELDADGAVAETHVLRRRADRDWDFALYDAAGVRRPASAHHPTRFRAPVTCFSCHRSAGGVPPFRDWPSPSKPVQGFTPGVRLELTPQQAARVESLKPNDRDGLFGPYGAIADLLGGRTGDREQETGNR